MAKLPGMISGLGVPFKERGAIMDEYMDAMIAHQAGFTNVVATLSPKGGCGKTVLSTNLAVELAGRDGLQVCLVDLDLGFGFGNRFTIL